MFKAAPQAKVVVHHTVGEKNSWKSFAPVEDVMAPGSNELVFASIGGRSSDGHMPFFNLAWGDGGVAMAIGWSSQWEVRFQRSACGTLTAQAGQQHVHCMLHPGESICTPRILLGSTILEIYYGNRSSPICASVNWTAPDGTYKEPHLSVMRPLAQRGIEVFWSDMDPQQWYPKSFPEGTGTWDPDPAKNPRERVRQTCLD
ncbi:MAG TPA: hypothetical protein P5186_07425 [Candidatus Paceibacterota bacterium]|nr:hypothetical protein [Verrucomicrobiota bacterium]HRY47860.1 hypothetical protein [Candidatus Paceibacterota bacterium]HSA02348.1 hypothetical protein [Candidatus Paceibacterota bacterium]